jgi:nitrogen regulatory protein PII-like uncharacterized protein
MINSSLNIYKCSKKDNICCNYGHKLIPVQGPKLRWHFRHPGICDKKLYISQKSAGNGKTWSIINMIQRKEFLHFTTFIYVTKQHSARAIIKDEFVTQYDAGLLNITNFSFQIMGKKYVIEYTNSANIHCTIIIATIDSFFYCIGDKNVNTYNLFEGIVNSVLENPIIDSFRFANKDIKLSDTMYVLDESQDTPDIYGKALLKMLTETNITVYCVGDKLQSISNESNTFNYLIRSSFPKYFEPAINICRRFSHPQLVDFVNYMVPFSKYDLPLVTAYEKNHDRPDALTIIFENIKINMEDRIEEIMNYYKKEVEENNYLPQDFLIVTPFVSNNPFISCLNSAINEFWIQKYQGSNYDTYVSYSVFHKSEIGSSINLDESKDATRIVSIHSSKGDGRNCVFVIGLHETSLKTFSGLRDSLIYDSLLHVAITRMKKKLYITCNENDEIGQRIKNYLLKNDMPCYTHSLFIDPKINIKNIIPACGERINNLLLDDYQGEDQPNMPRGFYTIRYGLMFQQVCKKLKDQYFDRMSHIKVIRDIALNAPIVICISWKEYNMRLKMNTGTEENQYSDKETSIPLLNIKGYSTYFNLIYENIEIIRNTNGTSLSCLQSIIFYYMTQVTSRGKYTHMNILELYKIIDQYNQCDDLDSDFERYVLKHDEYMNCVDKLCDPLLELKMSWNPHVSIEYDFDIILKTQIDLIGYNKDTVLLTYLKPELNRMNFNELKIKAFIDSYIVSKCGNIKYMGKKIKICILAINAEPYFMEYNDFESLRNTLKETLFDYFSIKNKEISQYKGHFQSIRPSLSYIKNNNLHELNCGLKELLEKF